MPSLSDLEDFIEENLPRNLQELPHKVAVSIQEYYEVLYEQLNKYGPPLSDLPSLPSLNDLTGKVHDIVAPITTTQPLPPPPPPPPTTLQAMRAWTRNHSTALSIAGSLVVVGLGTSYAYKRGLVWLPYLGRKQVVGSRRTRQVRFRNGVRREAVIVLGGDTPLGRSMAMHFSSQGFIVLASVASSAALTQFENIIPPSSRGYVKALVYDTSDPSGSLQPFIRALSAALSLRYPLTSAGDPYARPGENISITGVINALSFVSPDDDASLSRSISSSGYNAVGIAMAKLTPSPAAELLDKHVVSSLCVLGALLPMLRALPNRAEAGEDTEPVTVVTLVSSPASRTSLPRQGVYSVIAQGVAAGVQSLRRECDEDTFHSKTASNSRVPSSASASTSSASGTRRTSSSRPSLKQRDVRITVVEVNSGSVWGESVPAAGEGNTSPSASANFGTASSRPSIGRSPSSSIGSLWHHRSPTSAPVLHKVSNLLLSTKRRLRPTYTVGTYSLSSYWLAISHAIYSIVPTSVVDFAMTMRRQLSLRRSGLIGRAEHAFLPWNWSRSAPADETPRPIAGPGPGPASSAHSRASLQASQLRRSAGAPYDIRDLDTQSLPESEKSSGAGSGIPSSVPSSAYGDNDGDVEVDVDEHGVPLSPHLGTSQPISTYSTDSASSSSARVSSGPASVSAADAWRAGPASSRDINSPASYASEYYDRNVTDSPLGTSWVALGDSQHSHQSHQSHHSHHSHHSQQH
ncbi:hypothetical protein BCV70DRAFT_5019 [Testicularia cyperi]|uniref:Uncharacterized protein n=1 Tax=Testicularia cyperi TaxID=1882483 RepID=A0A317XWS7_9BASI|nr:hypothetical protein BCV70DRAFT_5019 [Testicularia cyperi]